MSELCAAVLIFNVTLAQTFRAASGNTPHGLASWTSAMDRASEMRTMLKDDFRMKDVSARCNVSNRTCRTASVARLIMLCIAACQWRKTCCQQDFTNLIRVHSTARQPWQRQCPLQAVYRSARSAETRMPAEPTTAMRSVEETGADSEG